MAAGAAETRPRRVEPEGSSSSPLAAEITAWSSAPRSLISKFMPMLIRVLRDLMRSTEVHPLLKGRRSSGMDSITPMREPLEGLLRSFLAATTMPWLVGERYSSGKLLAASTALSREPVRSWAMATARSVGRSWGKQLAVRC